MRKVDIETKLKPRMKTTEVKIMRIVESASYRSKKDINDWRAALQLAEHYEKPRRRFLIDLYEELRLDAHIINLMNRYKRHLTQLPFLLRNKKNGKPDTEATKLLMKGWFLDTLRFKSEASFLGHSLIQIKKIDAEGIKEVELINRRNVVPELGSYIEDLNTDKLINYRDDPSLNKYLFEFDAGADNRFGYLNPAAPYILFKKNALIAWSEFCEIFGLPIRYVVTDNKRKTDIDRIEKALRDMGKAAYGIFHTGEEMKFAETQRTDTYNVFDKLKDACNREVTIMVLGETMTSEVGKNGSRAQAEVHQDTSNQAAEENRMNTEIWVNEHVMPKLEVHGYGLKNYEFYYPKQANFNAQQWAVYSGLLQHYEIDEKFFMEQYGVPITGKKMAGIDQGKTEGGEPGGKAKEKAPNPNDDEGEPAAKGIRIIHNIVHGSCCAKPEIHLSEPLFKELLKGSKQLLKAVYQRPQQTDYAHQYATTELLREALWKGFKGKPATFRNSADEVIGIDYNSPDYLAYTMMEANIMQFSAGKTVAMIQELNALARQHKTFEEFEKAATPVLGQYNGNYLAAEYNIVWATGQNAAEYHRMKADAEDYPYWQYITAGDARVRDAHRVLHKKVFKHDDPVWNTIYPPNGWNCRCYVKPLSNYSTDKLSNENEALDELAKSFNQNENLSELDKMRKTGFDKNRAELKVAFTESQQYIKKFDGSRLGINAYELPKLADVKRDGLTNVPQGRTKEDALNWYDENVKNGKTYDYAGRIIAFEKKRAEQHLTEKYIKEGRQNSMELINEVLTDPDEVWLQIYRGESYQYMYAKHYASSTVAVNTSLSNDVALTIETWFEINGDSNRKGILIKKRNPNNSPQSF